MSQKRIRSSTQLNIDADLNLNSRKIVNLAAGTNSTDAVNKQQLDSKLSIGQYVCGETPQGDINGTNKNFTLTNVPIAGTESVYLNGILQQAGSQNDYTINSNVITFTEAPIVGDTIKVNYYKV